MGSSKIATNSKVDGSSDILKVQHPGHSESFDHPGTKLLPSKERAFILPPALLSMPSRTFTLLLTAAGGLLQGHEIWVVPAMILQGCPVVEQRQERPRGLQKPVRFSALSNMDEEDFISMVEKASGAAMGVAINLY